MGCSGWGGDGGRSEGWDYHHHQNQTLQEYPSFGSFDEHLSSAENSVCVGGKVE